METILWTVFVLGILVFIHELGHFVAAKAAGIQVPRFSIGLGPRLVGFRVGETDYCLSAIPFGGYVKMTGMEAEDAGVGALEGDPLLQEAGPEDYRDGEPRERQRGEGRGGSGETVPIDPSRGFDSKPLAVRLVVILAGVFMNFVFGFLIFVGLSWFQGEPRLPTLVADLDPALVRADPQLGTWRGREIRAVNSAPVETWEEVLERLRAAPEEEPLRMAFADGSTAALDPGVRGEDLAAGMTFGLPPVVRQVQEGSAADGAGIRPGDRILTLDGRPVRVWEDVPEHIRLRAGRPVRVRVERGGDPAAPGGERTLEFVVTPGRQREPGQDNKFVSVGYLGVGTRVDAEPISFAEALRQGTAVTQRASGLILNGLGQLLTGQISFKSLGGPVAIGQITGYYQRQGLDQLFYWMALFSINLAILNLLPIPVLDGGHVIFLLVEGVRGRPLSARSKVRLSQVGMVMLILLMAWAVTSDVLRLLNL